MDREHYFGDICIPRRAFIKEHVSLIDVLRHGTRGEQLKEAEDQAAELHKETRGGSGRNSGYIRRLLAENKGFNIGKMRVDDAKGIPSQWIKSRYGKKSAPKLSGLELFLKEDVFIPEIESAFRNYKMDPKISRYQKRLVELWKQFEDDAESYGVKKEAVKHIYSKNPGLAGAITVESSRGKLPPLSSFAHRLRS
jgi:hypothetical protein